jgi:pyruvate/2-oxoglutarate dehydrogenase complex dihydrolipoamide acyltransferase (E2) component
LQKSGGALPRGLWILKRRFKICKKKIFTFFNLLYISNQYIEQEKPLLTTNRTTRALMATSADTLSNILQVLSRKYQFQYDDSLSFLAKEELLPKKLIPKVDKDQSPWASKRAEELAAQHGIVARGEGSGKNGKWTLKDVEKALEKPAKTKLLVSPNALNLANESKLSLVGKTGSGKDGRILLKDVEKWLAGDESEDEDELNISPRALQEAHEAGVSDEDLSTIHGSGKDGRILLEDVKKHITDSEKSDDED